MTDLDDKLIPRVKTIIEDLGKELTFTESTGGTYNPATGEVTGETNTDYAVKCSPPDQYEARFVNNDTIKVGDVRTFLPSQNLSFTPVRGMKVVFDSLSWKVLELRPIYSGDSIVVYELQLRQ